MEVLQQSGRSELEETLKRLQQHKARHAEITEISVNINVKLEQDFNYPLILIQPWCEGRDRSDRSQW